MGGSHPEVRTRNPQQIQGKGTVELGLDAE